MDREVLLSWISCCSASRMGNIEGPPLLSVFSLLTTCMVVFSLEQKYLHYKKYFEAPVKIMVSSSQMLFSCMMPFKSIMSSIA